MCHSLQIETPSPRCVRRGVGRVLCPRWWEDGGGGQIVRLCHLCQGSMSGTTRGPFHRDLFRKNRSTQSTDTNAIPTYVHAPRLVLKNLKTRLRSVQSTAASLPTCGATCASLSHFPSLLLSTCKCKILTNLYSSCHRPVTHGQYSSL